MECVPLDSSHANHCSEYAHTREVAETETGLKREWEIYFLTIFQENSNFYQLELTCKAAEINALSY